MTAEVALLNREAVALAADSAVTIGAGNQQKILEVERIAVAAELVVDLSGGQNGPHHRLVTMFSPGVK